MAKKQILTIPDPLLRKVSEPVNSVNSEVKKLMDDVITETSTYTKNTLMRHVRDIFVGNAHIKDVGKVVPKIIKEQLTRSGKWEAVTKKRFRRLRGKG